MSTFAGLLFARAAEHPQAIAMQEKRYGVWQPLTWAQYARRVREFAHGLAGLGIGRGDVVAVLGDNRPEWLITELAVQCLGGAVVGVYPTSVGEEILHVLSLAEVRIVVAEDQEQVDKLIRLKDQLPKLATIVYYDPRGLAGYPQPYLERFTDIEAVGAEKAKAQPAWLDDRVAMVGPDDTAIICTTSGTTARPKLAELSHANLIAMAEHLAEIDPVLPGYRYVSFLPLAWIGEQMLAVACGLRHGLTLSFPEDAATQRTDLREIAPDLMFSPPRIWESMLSEVQVRIDEAGWLKRHVFGWAYEVGDRMAAHRTAGRVPGVPLRIVHRVADAVGLRPVRDQLGLLRISRCYTGGAPLSPDVFRFFHALGVNLKQIYGQTEICGIAVAHHDGDLRFHTVGAAIPGTELRISDDGEILLRSPSVFRGYLHDPQATAAATDPDGWLHTGDAGYLDDGHLVVIDRQADVLHHPADGSRFSNAFIENKLKFSPYVEEAVAFLGRHGITAILCLDPATVGAWAERTRIGYTTYTDLAAQPPVADLLAAEIARANADLPASMRIRRFVLLHKQLDPDDDEITRTRKVRRNVIATRYADVIAALDGDEPAVDVHTTVAYQDGSAAERAITLTIHRPIDIEKLAGQPRRPVWSGRA
ncbi:AMP-binding protein [Virgisporangium aurantiacum]|uniref:Acyl-CoA synthetase n=1 Tax=Virgisporangium aurantiacum TaxID=175570 RepID=A0A8J4E7K9_9ACTN|nr:AMP-binding protein [Virgisporangium aurantiacum]GIJ64419.1 long-chain-fatty-acid--CoA ligase [Virgisporangium aurantiacum]